MALTLIEAAKIAMGRGDVLQASIMELYARSSEIVGAIPFENISGNALKFQREKELPGVGFRGVNEGYTESTGKTEPVTESLAIAGGDLDVDKFLVDTSGADQRAVQEAMKVKALSLSMARNVIKGSILVDPKGFDGLQVRCTDEQLIAAGGTAGGDPLSLAKLDEAIDAVEDPTHLMMSKAMRRRLSAAARNSSVGGNITYDKNDFGARITYYNDLPILIADKDNTNAYVLPFAEACPGGGANVGTSLYCLSLRDNGVVGLQNGEMQVRDLGELESKPVFRTRVEWYITLAVIRDRAVARLNGVKDAPVTA